MSRWKPGQKVRTLDGHEGVIAYAYGAVRVDYGDGRTEWWDDDKVSPLEDHEAPDPEYKAMLDGIEYGAEFSWDYALDAARDAVAALDIGRDVRFSVDVKADALAAIDALREKP